MMLYRVFVIFLYCCQTTTQLTVSTGTQTSGTTVTQTTEGTTVTETTVTAGTTSTTQTTEGTTTIIPTYTTEMTITVSTGTTEGTTVTESTILAGTTSTTQTKEGKTTVIPTQETTATETTGTVERTSTTQTTVAIESTTSQPTFTTIHSISATEVTSGTTASETSVTSKSTTSQPTSKTTTSSTTDPFSTQYRQLFNRLQQQNLLTLGRQMINGTQQLLGYLQQINELSFVKEVVNGVQQLVDQLVQTYLFNGNWTSWSAWSMCNSPCGGGTTTRIRTCDNPEPSFGGLNCTGGSLETISCNTDSCPVDGNWGMWSAWGQCFLTRDGGISQKTRQSDNPEAMFGGRLCVGQSVFTQSCDVPLCRMNGNWGNWTSWSDCVCGTATRRRACDNPSPSYEGLTCPGNSTETRRCKTDPCLGDLRLRDGPFVNKGRLEVFYDNKWGTVCADNFDDKDATVACRQLGYSTGFMVKSSFILDGSCTIWLNKLECSGTEQTLDGCKNSGWGVHACRHQEDIGVECFNSLNTGALRIIEERFPNQGRLEVYHYQNTNGIWGTICDDYFDDVDALVACRHMGYRTGITLGNNVIDGSGIILLDDVNCTGTETTLSSCGHNGWGISNCTHSDDVGVQCFVVNKEEQKTCCSSGVVAGIAISCIALTIVCSVAVIFVRKRLLTLDKEMKTPDTYVDVRAAQAPVFYNLACTEKKVSELNITQQRHTPLQTF